MNNETTTCIHCGQHTANIERYNLAGRDIVTHTCRNKECYMWGVTKAPDVHQEIAQDPAQIEAWAAMVAKMRSYQGGA